MSHYREIIDELPNGSGLKCKLFHLTLNPSPHLFKQIKQDVRTHAASP